MLTTLIVLAIKVGACSRWALIGGGHSIKSIQYEHKDLIRRKKMLIPSDLP